MKLTKPENDNYAAVVFEIKETHQLEGCDNVVGTTIYGYQAIVGKDTKPGAIGLFFPAETQLSEKYASENNMFRHSEMNKDKEAKGYIEDNRRVKAMKFRGHRSDCLFMPLESLSYIKGLKLEDLSEGDTFDKIGDYEICKKYTIKRSAAAKRLEKNKLKFVRVDKKFLPEHYDSDNYFRNSHVIPNNAEVIVTQKIHGTSIRIGNTYVARKLNIFEQAAKRLGLHIQEQEFDYVFGSRKVIKDVNNPNQNHFYETDIWTQEGKRLEGLLPKGYIVYGELIGWVSQGKPIQKNYTYQVPDGTADLYVYRIAHINPDGYVSDLSWDQLVEFCRDHGMKHVPELWRGRHGDFLVDNYLNVKFQDTTKVNTVPLDKESPCDEGVCIRYDGIAPYILKAKSPMFLEHETAMLDQEAVDLEADQSEDIN